MNAAMVTNQRIAGREHFPISVYPKRWYALRVAQLLGAIICMSLAAYAQANWTRSKAGPFTIVTVRIQFSFIISTLRLPTLGLNDTHHFRIFFSGPI